MTAQNNISFAALFKKYRLRSEIETLAEFGNLLAQEGLIYEDSLFARWQNGSRVPKERKILLKIINVFVSHKGIKTLDEANKFLDSANQKPLTKEETASLLFSEKSILGHHFDEVKIIEVIKLALNSRFTDWIFALFAMQTIWFIRIQTLHLNNTIESYYFNWVYGLIALSGAIYGLTHRKNPNSYLTIQLSFGLLSEWFGVQLWFYYNLKGIKVPFPSFADIGYAGIIPIYISATLRLLNPQMRFNRRVLFILSPITMLGFCYSIFLRTIGFSFIHQLKLLLNFVHPTGEIVPIIILVYLLAFSSKSACKKLINSALLLSFFAQFFTDYLFMYTDQTNTYTNAGIVDYFYVISYMLMCFAILLIIKSSESRIKNNRLTSAKKLKTTYIKHSGLLLSS